MGGATCVGSPAYVSYADHSYLWSSPSEAHVCMLVSAGCEGAYTSSVSQLGPLGGPEIANLDIGSKVSGNYSANRVFLVLQRNVCTSLLPNGKMFRSNAHAYQ